MCLKLTNTARESNDFFKRTFIGENNIFIVFSPPKLLK